MKNKKGFTLIELLIVVAIIGILLSIGVGACSKEKIGDDGTFGTTQTKSTYKMERK